MTISLYEITIPVFIREMKTLSRLLQKGVAFTKEEGAKISEEALVESRRIADIHEPFVGKNGRMRGSVLVEVERAMPEMPMPDFGF
jgi:hypothetical protein